MFIQHYFGPKVKPPIIKAIKYAILVEDYGLSCKVCGVLELHCPSSVRLSMQLCPVDIFLLEKH